MKKEIIVNADELESRVAVIEDGQLAELTVERDPRIVGSIYKARVVSVLPGMDAAFADVGLEKNVFLSADDVGFVSRDGVTVGPAPRSLSISQRLKEKQEVVVQIVRAPVGGKGARATTRLALPGRYLVMLVSDARQIGVSRRIEDRTERARLRKIGESIRPDGTGIIIRTEGEGRDKRDLESDLKVLLDLRDRITKKAARAKAPALLHQDLTLTYQTIRDAFTQDVSALVIDSKSVYESALELVRTIAPRLRRRVKRYRGKLPIFHKYDVEDEIDRLLRRRVWLPAGGYISIDQAEAFTAIDVNTGRFTGSTGLADTILRTNLDAATEIARQLRLRDLGGIIVIDFIDMDRPRHRQRVMKAFEQALQRDRQKTKILHLSPLGLIEMTRKRRGDSLRGILTETCPHCAGLGRVRRPLTVGLKIEREVRRLLAEQKAAAAVVRAAPQVASSIIGENGERSAALDNRVGGPVYIRGDHALGLEEYHVTPATREEAAAAVKTYKAGDEIIVDHLDAAEAPSGEDSYGWVDGYRLVVEGGMGGVDGQTVLLTRADSSFGRARPKSKKAAPEKTEKKEPRKRRRPASKRSRSRRKPKPAAAKDAPAASPAPKPPPPPAREQSAPAPPAPASKKRSGLLRRGARRVARPRR